MVTVLVILSCLAIFYLIFELEVTAGPLLGDEQQVVEEEEVPLLALQTLQREI